jgi:arsenite methyltransferase
MDDSQIYEEVQKRYGAVAKSNHGDYGRRVAAAFGYSEEELTSIPAEANLGLSCGNPLALAKLREVHPHPSLPIS